MGIRDDRAFFERISPEWLRSYARRMLRVEERLSARDPVLDVDAMPPWAFVLTGRLLESKGMRVTTPERLTVQRMGYMLGLKVVTAEVVRRLCMAWDKATDGDRAKLTNLLGGPAGVKLARSTREALRDVSALKIALLKSIPKRTMIEQGRFFRGYGEGLLALGNPKNKRGMSGRQQMVLFAVLHWNDLQNLANSEGWPGVKAFFVEQQAFDQEISEDAFVKMLQQAGMKSGLKTGRPRKFGKQSS